MVFSSVFSYGFWKLMDLYRFRWCIYCGFVLRFCSVASFRVVKLCWLSASRFCGKNCEEFFDSFYEMLTILWYKNVDYLFAYYEMTAIKIVIIKIGHISLCEKFTWFLFEIFWCVQLILYKHCERYDQQFNININCSYKLISNSNVYFLKSNIIPWTIRKNENLIQHQRHDPFNLHQICKKNTSN